MVAGGCGGTCNEHAIGIQSAELYNPMTNEWKRVADLPVPLHSARMDLLDNTPTLIGGFDGENLRENDVIYQYDLTDDVWTDFPTKLKMGRSSPAVFQVPSSLFQHCQERKDEE